MRLIDICCSKCNKVSKDYIVGDTELGFDMPHTCPVCEGPALRIPNTTRLRGTKKGTETHTYLEGTKRAGFSELLLANELRERAMDTFDDAESARLNREADKVEASSSAGQE